MRQRQENYVMISEHIRGGLVNNSFHQWNQMGLVLTEQSSGVGACSHRPDFHVGMRKQQPEQLPACITCSTRYRDPRNHSHEYAIPSNFMHLEYQGLVRSIAALAAPNAGHVRMAHENITVLIEVMAGMRSEAQRVFRITTQLSSRSCG